jgi:Fe(3+) dicitrate transport protein
MRAASWLILMTLVATLAAPEGHAAEPAAPLEEEVLDAPAEGEDDAPAEDEDDAPAALPRVDEATDDAPASDEDEVVDDAVRGDAKDPYRLRGVKIKFTEADVFRTGGSATTLDTESLERQRYDDAQSVLARVPGVYLRTEDGYGLRPNIGLRGADSDRSKKVTLMEDGILFGPAPYSAPAAYYFPLMARITGVEVFKGPAAIMYGPNTIGGAVNLVSRPVPSELALRVDAAFGTDIYGKLHAFVGTSNDWGGFLIEGAHVRTNGFKDLDGGGDTGFAKTEVTVKGQVHTDAAADVFHRVEVKGTFSLEGSNETYLGLTDADAAEAPYRRYRASALDRMDWRRFAVALRYDVLVGDAVDVVTQLYWHRFERDWFKLNRFADATRPIADVLANPAASSNAVYAAVLRGEEDSSGPTNLFIGNNGRKFTVLGGQTAMRLRLATGPVAHEVELGLRYHFDEIERDHTEDEYEMVSGRLVRTATPRLDTTQNTGSAHAFATYLRYGLTWKGLTVTPGLRLEHIGTALRDRTAGTELTNTNTTVLGGVGVTYAVLDELVVLAGVHQGFSPVAPGQAAEVSPEQSVNVEAGLRYAVPETSSLAEAIFFFNDYTNIVGQCAFSTGCGDDALDRQFNGGAATVLGLEVAASHRFQLGRVHLPARLAYTFTRATFGTSFSSDLPQFGDVRAGDELPYVPPHQLSAEVGVGMDRWDLTLLGTYIAAMREVAGQGKPEPGDETDPVFYLDAMFRGQITCQLQAYVRAENVLLQETIASRRPFGARPGKPFIAQIGLQFDL